MIQTATAALLAPTVRTPVASSPLDLDRVTLARFLDHCHRRKYPNRTDVFRPGDAATTLYYVVSGSVSVISEESDDRELVLSYANAGDFVGEMGLFVKADKRVVTLRTRSPAELAEISYERLWQVLDGPLKADCAKVLFAVGAQLTRRLLQTNRKVSRLAFLDVTGRVARQLLDLTQEPEAIVHPRGMQVRISRQELSRLVGCSREMVGRVLKQLHEAGKLVVRGKTIVVIGAPRRA